MKQSPHPPHLLPRPRGLYGKIKVIAVADLIHNIMQKKMLKSHDAKFLHKLCLSMTLSGLLTDCVTAGSSVCSLSKFNKRGKQKCDYDLRKETFLSNLWPSACHLLQTNWMTGVTEGNCNYVHEHPALGVTLNLITSNYLFVIADIAGDVFDFIRLIKKANWGDQ